MMLAVQEKQVYSCVCTLKKKVLITRFLVIVISILLPHSKTYNHGSVITNLHACLCLVLRERKKLPEPWNFIFFRRIVVFSVASQCKFAMHSLMTFNFFTFYTQSFGSKSTLKNSIFFFLLKNANKFFTICRYFNIYYRFSIFIDLFYKSLTFQYSIFFNLSYS